MSLHITQSVIKWHRICYTSQHLSIGGPIREPSNNATPYTKNQTWQQIQILKKRSTLYDSVFGKRVLTYWENRGNLDYHQMNVFMVDNENYILLEREESHLSENI